MKINKSIFSWALCDFANSAFATSVLSVIFSVYFAKVLVPAEGVLIGGVLIPGESLWGYLISSVMAMVIFLSPFLGHVADVRSWKKNLLMFWVVLGSVCTMGLLFAVPGKLALACGLIFLATLGFEMSLVFYNAFLPEISDEATAGRVSGIGFGLGYIGGGLCLAINLLMIKRPEWFFLDTVDSTWSIRFCVFFVGVWWLVFSIPAFFQLKDRKREVKSTASVPSMFVNGFSLMKNLLSDLKKNPPLRRYLVAYLFYDDGVQTIFLMASIFGAKVLNMSTAQLALCYLAIQFVAFLGAYGSGELADKWGHKKVIAIGLVVYVFVALWAVFISHQWEFWILGLVVGVIMGGVQSASRSFFSVMVPIDRSAEYFSLFSIVGKATALMGPLVFGLTAQFFGIRWAVASMIVFFVVGGFILKGVPEPSRKVPLAA